MQDPALGIDIESMAAAERVAADKAAAEMAFAKWSAARLHAIFPEISEETLAAVLFQCGYDEDAAVSVLLSMNEAPVPPSSAPPASTPAASYPAWLPPPPRLPCWRAIRSGRA